MKMKYLFWTEWYLDHPPIESTLESSTNQQTRNIIYTTTQPTQKTKRTLSLMAFWSNAEEFVQKITSLNKRPKIYNQLKYRKYPTTVLNEAIEKVTNMDRLSLLKPSRKKSQDNNIRLITNYNPRNPNILHILKKIWRTITNDKETSHYTRPDKNNIHQKSKFERYAYKIKSILPTTTQTFPTMLATKMPDLYPHEYPQVISDKDNHSYPIGGNFHCKSSDIIYVMTCNVCNIQYVWETSNTMNSRCRGHESSIRTE